MTPDGDEDLESINKLMAVQVNYMKTVTLKTALQLGLFGLLSGGKKLQKDEIFKQLNIKIKNPVEFLDILVISGYLERDDQE